MNVKVSFIVISYNLENYIERCLKSIVNQTLHDIEIIVVDNGSTDNTLDIEKRIAKNDKRIKVIEYDNKGANEGRKQGFYYAKGEYVIFIDGDDWIENNLAKTTYEVAINGKYDIVAFNNYKDNSNNTSLKNNSSIRGDINNEQYLELVLEAKIAPFIWNKIINREYLKKVKFEDIIGLSMGEDLADNILLGLGYPKAIFIEDYLYHYCIREGSLSNKTSEKTLDVKKSLEYIEKLLESKQLKDKYKYQIEYLWFIHCYLSKVITSRFKIDSTHKKLYDIWKERNICLKKNNIYIEKKNTISIYRRFIKRLFDINYTMGAFALKIEHVLRYKRFIYLRKSEDVEGSICEKLEL